MLDALVLAIALGATPVPQVQPPASTLDEVGLEWVTAPTRYQMERAGPLFPPELEAWDPKVDLLCTARANGRLKCKQAIKGHNAMTKHALRVMGMTRVRTVDGASPEGRQFAFTVQFGLPRAASKLTTASIQ